MIIFTKVKGNLGKLPQDIPVLMQTMAADVKIRSPDALTSTVTTSATLVEFGQALLQVPGPTGRQAISPMATCVGMRKW